MVNKEKIKELAQLRGFTLWARIGQNRLQFMDCHGINLFVDVDTKNFELQWLVPRSIFAIQCPSCSPFDNEEHFQKIYKKFCAVVQTFANIVS